jgi:hypothetical protein
MEMHMDTMLGFVGLVITTLVALFAALALKPYCFAPPLR